MLAIIGIVVIVGALVGIGVTENNASDQQIKQEITHIQQDLNNS